LADKTSVAFSSGAFLSPPAASLRAAGFAAASEPLIKKIILEIFS
jgi:hypothetical protein